MDLREFRRAHDKGERLWQIWVEGEEIHTCAGWVGGKMTKTSDRPGGTKRETAAERALSRARKKIKDKLNKGYVEYAPGTDTIIGDEAGTEVDFQGPAPENLEVFKPRPMPKEGSREHKNMMAVINGGREIIARKYDGMKHILTITEDEQIVLRTRRGEDATEHYPYLIQDIRKLSLPARSVLAVELIIPTNGGKGPEDFKTMQSLSRSTALRAQQLQMEDATKRPHAILLAPIYWKGQPIIRDLRVIDWLTLLEGHVHGARRRSIPYIHAMQIFEASLEEALEYVEEIGIEGLVVYDSEVKFGEKAFNFRGKADRPDCWKQKPIYEDDFIAVFDPEHKRFSKGGGYGKGKLQQSAGHLALYQYAANMDLVYICNVGTGLDEQTRDMIAKKAEENNYWIGTVAVEYVSRKYLREGDGSNALTFPSFKKIHEDKDIDECIDPRL